MTGLKKIKVVTLGGGTGMFSLLHGLKYFPMDITAIVTVSDDGGSSGMLRNQFDMPAPGDIRNVIVALSESEPLVQELFQYRFQHDEFSGHPTGNLLLAAMYEITGDFSTAVAALCEVLNVKGKVYPSTKEASRLLAELDDGTILEGESNIGNASRPIKRVFLDKEHETHKKAIDAILRADAIILGPGSLFTSIIPNLLVTPIHDAILRTKAKKIYVANIMMEANETIGFTTTDHLKAIEQHVGEKIVDAVIVNDGNIPRRLEKSYKTIDNVAVSRVDYEELEAFGVDIIKSRLVDLKANYVRHDSLKLAASIFSYLIE